MKLHELRNIAEELHNKANASSGISASEDNNEAMAEKLDQIIEADSYELQDIIDEQHTYEQVIQYLSELIGNRE